MHEALAGISLVAFDLDGTLIDSAPDLAAALDATLAELGHAPAGIAKVRSWVGNGSRKLVERALADAGARASDREAAHRVFLQRYAAAPCELTRVYAGAAECLDALRGRGLALALITNKPVALIEPILDALCLRGFFAPILGGDSLAQRKPHPAPLAHAAKHTGVTPYAALMVGDSRTDTEAAKAAGFRSLAVSYGYNHGEPIAACGPDHIVASLAELGD